MEMMRRIRDSLLYIDNHLEEPITVSSIADAAGYSEYHFSRCFKQEMQMSVMEYVKKRRLIKASEAVLREVYEETGVHYEIDHLAVIHENFFNENNGSLKGIEHIITRK